MADRGGEQSGYVTPEQRETPHDRAVRKAAEEALFWIKKGEFTRNSTAIWRAIKNAHLDNNRAVYDQVKDALYALSEWKEMKRKEKERKEQDRIYEETKREQHMKEAYAHQMRQPRDAWDNAYDPLEDDDED